MPHRVFIAINLPEEIKNRLYSFRDEYSELPCRWTKKDNLHFTLLFLGYVSDQEIMEICQTCRDAAQRHQVFSLEINRVVYGPPGKKAPRMVWAQGLGSKELSRLQRDLENSLFENSGKIKENDDEKETRGFAPHITLARIKQWELQKVEREEIPEINKEISLSFPVASIEVMESELKREGPEYIILESCPLLL